MELIIPQEEIIMEKRTYAMTDEEFLEFINTHSAEEIEEALDESDKDLLD